MVAAGRMVTSSRRAGRVTNKTKLLIYRGSDKVDLAHAEVILWSEQDGENAPKNQHVGASGVESGEMLEHHLQAALSSHSLLHSQAASRPSATSSPTPSSSRLTKPDPSAAPVAPPAALNYHIPTPDATGLVLNEDYVRLYQAPSQRYHEPSGFIRFSDTVEEASGGWGGLGYCMDDEDERWLADFNGKQQGGSGSSTGESPLREKEGKENVPVPASAGRERRGKGKEREKEAVAAPPPPLIITEEAFEFVMGMMEKYADEMKPALHTNLSLIPTFAAIEPLFSSSINASFLPSNEIPRTLPEPAALLRISRSIHTHWKARRERRKGRPIMPQLNYDETNDGDPYVCFRRRDIRATRKTRRTDNFSVEQMQKLQYELRTAHDIAKMVVSRELDKKRLYDAEKEVWEAKWKLYETKKRWPSLGITGEEEAIITGRMLHGATPASSHMGDYGGMSGVNGQQALQASHPNIPRMSKKMVDREREDERQKRDRVAEVASRGGQDRNGAGARWFAPDELKARMMVLRQKLEEELMRRKEMDVDWDDATDASYQPLPHGQAEHAFRSVAALDTRWARELAEDNNGNSLSQLPSFRLRLGRGGIEHLDRRFPPAPCRRGPQPTSPTGFSNWLYPDTCSSRPARRRPTSIDDIEPEDEIDPTPLKRRRLNEAWRYDADNGGALGVGMGLDGDQDQIIIDDMDSQYIRHRVTLLREDDLEKLQPDLSVIRQAMASLDEPQELPPMPHFNRPAPPSQFVNAQIIQQQAQQQQQMETFQRYQMQQQLQAQMAVQQHQQLQAQAQLQAAQQQQQASGQQTMPNTDLSVAQLQSHLRLASNGSANANGNGTPPMQNQMLPPGGQPMNGRPIVKRTASAMSGSNGNPAANGGSMPPPSQTPLRPPSASPSNGLQHLPLPNGQSPQMMNGNGVPNGKPIMSMQPPNLQLQAQAMDPAFQQRLMAQARAQHQLQQQQQLANGGGGAGGGMDMNDSNIAALNALIANTTNVQQQQQLQMAQMQNGVGAGTMPDLNQQAQAAGFNNIQAYIDARSNKAKMLRTVASIQMQQAHQAAMNGGNGAQGVPMAVTNSNTSSTSNPNGAGNTVGTPNNGNGNTAAQSAAGSPSLPTGHLQLKLPPHAKARLAGQQQVIVQRAQ